MLSLSLCKFWNEYKISLMVDDPEENYILMYDKLNDGKVLDKLFLSYVNTRKIQILQNLI